MAVPVEQVDLSLAHVSTAVNRVPRLSVIVVEPDHVDWDVKPLIDLKKVDRAYGVFNRIQSVLRKISICVPSLSIGISVRIIRKQGREQRVAETALVVILDVDDRLLFRKELWELLVAAPMEWIELQDLKGDRVDLGKDQSRYLPDELRVWIFDSGCETLHQPVILRASSIKRLVALEDAERRNQVCLHRLGIHVQRVCRLVSNVKVRPDL